MVSELYTEAFKDLFDATLDNPGLTAALVPLGDGILMLRKNVADVQLPDSE